VTRTELGKIDSVHVGFGGYQDACFGVTFTIRGKAWGVGDFWGTWAHEPGEYSKWTTEEQSAIFADTSRRLIELLNKAGKSDVSQLAGIPLEVTFDGTRMVSWRVLEEVL
jgi:hypothetical protein